MAVVALRKTPSDFGSGGAWSTRLAGACCLAAALLLAPAPVFAQGALSKAFPNGAQRGTTVEVSFAGTSIPEEASLLVEGAGLKGVGPFKKGVGKIEVAPDAAPGVRQVRLAGPKGVTSPRPFSVGSLPELLEKEPNGTAAQAQRIAALPVTINGTLPARADLDLFTVSLKRGECLVVAGEARALGAPTNLLARIRSADGQELVAQMDYRTRDPLFGFTAPADGEYTVELQDVLNNYSNINADYVYRVTLTKGPWLDTVSPPGAQRGQATRMRFSGWNIGMKSGPGSVEQEVTVPRDAGGTYEVTAGGAPNRVPIVVGDVPELAEAEPVEMGGGAAGLSSPQRLVPPVTVNGVFGERGDLDRFQFSARKGERLRIDVDARAIGSFADPVLVVRDASGGVISTVDDAGRVRDPRLVWTAPADGEFTVHLRDIAAGSRGGPEYFYRLTIAPPAPELGATTSDPTLVLAPGKTLPVTVKVTGAQLAEPVTVTAEGLPAGVTAAPVTASVGKSGTGSVDVKLSLVAAPGAAPSCTLVRLVAKSAGLTASAAATWVLATDRSGTLAQGSTEYPALLVPAP